MTDPVMKDFMEDQAQKRKNQSRKGNWWKWVKTILKSIGDGIEVYNKSHWR